MVHITVSFLKLFILKREQRDGVVGLLARIMLKIISFTLLSVVDFMHKLGQATYFSVSQFPVWQIEITLIYSFPQQWVGTVY